MNLKPAGTQTLEYFRDELGTDYSRDGYGRWLVYDSENNHPDVPDDDLEQELEAVYQTLKAEQ